MLLLNKYLKTSKLLLVVCLFLFKNILVSQSNLIQNSGFEKYSNLNCNNVAIDDYSVFPAKHVLNNWETLNSSDYFTSVCSPTNTYRGVPINDFGHSHALEGDAYTGLIAFTKAGETKEYIFQHLNTSLKADTAYCLSFYTSRADRITHALYSLGAFFSINTPTLFSNYYVNATPQVVNQNGFIADTISWTEIRGCFTAQGGEQYVTIGNFNSNANTDTLFVGSTNPLSNAPGYAYYYIDSVSLWQNNFPTAINEIDKDEFVSVYPNPAKDLINFKFSNAIEKRKVEIYDAFGKLVLTKNETDANVTVSTSYLPNGIYFYKINKDYKTIKSGKIVVIK